jgi:hypothetical protein
MHRVSAEGTVFFYFTQSEDPADNSALPLAVTIHDPEVMRWIRRRGDVRLVVFESMLRRGRGNAYYLFWNDARDLDALDLRVANGTCDDGDFGASVKTTYQITHCDQCGSHWHTLVIPPGDPYPGAPGLIDRKIAASKFEACPACKASLRQMVVKILGQVGSASSS